AGARARRDWRPRCARRARPRAGSRATRARRSAPRRSACRPAPAPSPLRASWRGPARTSWPGLYSVTAMPNPTLLDSHPLLANLAPEQLARISKAGDVESYNAGEAIVADGSLGDALFLILSGQVAVHRGAQTFATLSAGEFFGE